MLIDLTTNKQFELPVFIVSASTKKSKNNKNYITGTVKDKTATIRYYFWDVDNVSATLPVKHKYALITGRLEIFNNNKQINMAQVKYLDKDSINPSDFKKASIYDVNVLWKEMLHFIDAMKDKVIKDIAKMLVADDYIEKNFKYSPAARTVHNAWVGGLLEHSVMLAKLSMNSADYYEKHFKNKINKDMVTFGCLFHDVGKMWEFNNDDTPSIETTTKGELLGHIYIGANKVNEIAEQYIHKNKLIAEDINLKINKLVHIVLSHHGKLEFGSPVNPKIPEAIIVHYLDNLDTRLMNAWENMVDCKEEFTDRIFIQENTKLLNVLRTEGACKNE